MSDEAGRTPKLQKELRICISLKIKGGSAGTEGCMRGKHFTWKLEEDNTLSLTYTDSGYETGKRRWKCLTFL